MKHINDGINNIGNYNCGDGNEGNYNVGNNNVGNSNVGYRNTGWNNNGWENTGFGNVGYGNTGNYNIGNCNTGSCNTGDQNTGDFNAGDYNTGVFNTQTPCLSFFDKPSDWTMDDWVDSDARAIMLPLFSTISPSKWIPEEDMTYDEKTFHPEYKITGGFLKRCTDQVEKAQKWWDNLTDEEKVCIKSIPNFDSEKFEKILGIKIVDNTRFVRTKLLIEVDVTYATDADFDNIKNLVKRDLEQSGYGIGNVYKK